MKDLSSGSIPGHIVSMSIQMAIGILVQTLYFFVDLYFVSQARRCGDRRRHARPGISGSSCSRSRRF